jgi:plastocyanin
MLASTYGAGFATQHTVTNVGTTFSPATLPINIGDTVVFSLASSHNAVQVSLATWTANQNTALPGGFSVPFGVGSVAFPTEGIYYYVCHPHASIGMKGIILVGNVSPVTNVTNENPLMSVFPNPTADFITISYTLNSNSDVNIRLINSVGQEVGNILHESQSAGEYQEPYSLKNNLPKGIYFVVMNSDNQSYIQRIIVK